MLGLACPSGVRLPAFQDGAFGGCRCILFPGLGMGMSPLSWRGIWGLISFLGLGNGNASLWLV